MCLHFAVCVLISLNLEEEFLNFFLNLVILTLWKLSTVIYLFTYLMISGLYFSNVSWGSELMFLG